MANNKKKKKNSSTYFFGRQTTTDTERFVSTHLKSAAHRADGHDGFGHGAADVTGVWVFTRGRHLGLLTVL